MVVCARTRFLLSLNSPQNHTLKTSIRHKNSEKGPTFSSEIPERFKEETIQWHTPMQKYYEFSPGLETIKKAFYCLLISVSIPEIGAFKVLEILRKNGKTKLNILCPFNKNRDVTSRTSTYSIFKSNVVQALLVRIK